MNREYLIVVEQAEHNFAAYSPDLPGCVATGKTRQNTIRLMRDAIAMHIAGLEEDGLPVPEPATTADYVSI